MPVLPFSAILFLSACTPDGLDRFQAQNAEAQPQGIATDGLSDIKLVASDAATGTEYGDALAAGDINGDGYDDVIVGSQYHHGTASYAGAVYIYYGSASGTDPTDEDILQASDGTSGDYFGCSVGTADIDNDGYDDVIVGARYAPVGGSSTGATYIYFGSSSGIDASSEDKIYASDGEYGDAFGKAVAGAGDVDGDGYADVVISADGDDDNGSGAGAIYVYYGSASGLDPAREDKRLASDGLADDDFGEHVNAAGDVDGDGYDDLIVSAWRDDRINTDSGSAYVLYGSASGLDPSREDKLTPSDGTVRDIYFGYSVSGVGDLDADGYDDVMVGSHQDDDNGNAAGAAYVYFGSNAGVDTTREHKMLASDGASLDYYGYAVAGGGDVDGDGYDDLLIGAYADTWYGVGSGTAYVRYGGSGGLNTGRQSKIVSYDAAGNDAFGKYVSFAGDVNGDGFADLVVGAPYDDSGNPGSVYVFLGADEGYCADGDGDGLCDSDDTCPSDAANTTDLNADGCPDDACDLWQWFNALGPSLIDASARGPLKIPVRSACRFENRGEFANAWRSLNAATRLVTGFVASGEIDAATGATMQAVIPEILSTY
jgi:hypothetical protein